MWVLECEGDLLANKRQWLCPGQTYTIGRTGQGDKTSHPIGGKYSMSRKHLVIEVKPVKSGSGVSTLLRSEVRVTDHSKHGTILDDGDNIKGCTVTLTQERHTFVLGRCPYKFVVSWQPKIFTFSLSKDQRHQKGYLEQFQKKVEKYDVKTIDTFVSDKTTLIISDKRNTSKSLIALVNGLHFVQHSYIDAVARACARDPKDPEEHSLLEQDYDGNWPDPKDYLPPPGKEPIKRDPALFGPDMRRKCMMEGYTVVVSESVQKDNLMEPVSEAGGKLVYKKVEANVTTPEEFVRAAGGSGKAVYVRPQINTFKGNEKWLQDFVVKVEKMIGYRTAVQNEFLEAILMIDMASLKRPASKKAASHNDEDDDAQMELLTHPPPEPKRKRASAAKVAEVVPESPEHEMEDVEEPAQKGRPARSRSSSVDLVIHKPPERTRTQKSQFTQSKPSQAVSRFEDSDDDFEPLPPPSTSMSMAATQRKNNNGNRHVSQVAFVDEIDEEDGDDGSETQTRNGTQRQTRNNMQRQVSNVSQMASSLRKRSAPQIDEEEEEEREGNIIEKILPGAAAMKKRRLEEEKRQQLESAKATHHTIKAEPMDEDVAEEVAVTKKPATRSRKKPPIEEDEVIKATKLIRAREEAEEVAKRAEAADRMDNDELAGLKNLALVETFEILPRTTRPSRSDAYGDEGSRWDERWNGRKNFKKFRRKDGAQTRMRRLAAPLLVELVEHKARDFGIGDDYWLDKNKKKDGEPSQPEGNSQFMAGSNPVVEALTVESDSDSKVDELRFITNKSQPKTQVPKTQTQTQKTTQRNTQSQSQQLSLPRSTRSTRSTNVVAATQDTPAASGGRSQMAGKRTKPAASAAQPKKKQKTSMKGFLAKNDDSEDGSEDELKFRF